MLFCLFGDVYEPDGFCTQPANVLCFGYLGSQHRQIVKPLAVAIKPSQTNSYLAYLKLSSLHLHFLEGCLDSVDWNKMVQCDLEAFITCSVLLLSRQYQKLQLLLSPVLSLASFCLFLSVCFTLQHTWGRVIADLYLVPLHHLHST